jgi:hypothetical protein
LVHKPPDAQRHNNGQPEQVSRREAEHEQLLIELDIAMHLPGAQNPPSE